jgi:hypothetical protein
MVSIQMINQRPRHPREARNYGAVVLGAVALGGDILVSVMRMHIPESTHKIFFIDQITPKVSLNMALQIHPWLYRYKTAVRYTTAELVSKSPDRWKVDCYLEGTEMRVTSDPCHSKFGAEEDAASKMKELIKSTPRE